MKKFLVAVVLFSSIFTLYGESTINFDMTLEKLATLISEGKSSTINPDQFLIIEGTVSGREVLNPDKNDYSAILDISSGRWEGTEKIFTFHCYVQLKGSKFEGAVPVRRSRKPNPKEISLNSRILILGKYIGYTEDEKGNKYPVITGLKIRK